MAKFETNANAAMWPLNLVQALKAFGHLLGIFETSFGHPLGIFRACTKDA